MRFWGRIADAGFRQSRKRRYYFYIIHITQIQKISEKQFYVI
jgi:hypothetical protein